jgi:DNA-binding LytR/AlgR family response regulator
MKVLRALICDDEPLARALLRTLLADAGDVDIVAEAAEPRQAVALAAHLSPDVVFLDIDMPGGSGVNAAHEIIGGTGSEVVFVTAHEQHAVDAFDIGAVDYVLKPIRRARLGTALERLRLRLQHKRSAPAQPEPGEPVFWVSTRHGKLRLPISSVLWIEAARDQVYFHALEQSYIHRATMDELESLLAGTGLVRVHRSAFVRLDAVTAILRQGKSLLVALPGGRQVRIGPSYAERVLTALPH